MIVCLWLPNWPMQRLFQDRPELKSRRVALHVEQRGLKIVASNRPEVVGRPVAEVTSFHLEPHDAAADQSALQQLAQWCGQFSPLVGLAGTDCLLLDVTGLAAWFDMEQFAKAVARRGLEARVAAGATIGAAWAGAHYDEPLPVESLRLPAKTVETLHELGLRQLAEVQALPRDGVALRFPEVLTRLDQFSGALAETLSVYHAQPTIEVERRLEYPLDCRQQIESVLAPMIETIASELASRQQGASRLELSLTCQPQELRLCAGLYQASCSVSRLRELVAMRLERIQLPSPVTGIRLTVLLSARLRDRQRKLFGDDHERERQLAAFIERTSCRVRLSRAVLVADAQPEHAVRYEPVTENPRPAKAQEGARKPAYRPLLLAPRPIPVEAIGTAHGPPMQFCFQGQQQRTLCSWGPERIQTGWWRGHYIRRDYYRVETASGQYWLFSAGGKWFLHGVFD